MDDDIFNNWTPYDRFVNIEARVAQLESNVVELGKAINIQHQHLVEINKTMVQTQQMIMEIRKWQNQQ